MVYKYLVDGGMPGAYATVFSGDPATAGGVGGDGGGDRHGFASRKRAAPDSRKPRRDTSRACEPRAKQLRATNGSEKPSLDDRLSMGLSSRR